MITRAGRQRIASVLEGRVRKGVKGTGNTERERQAWFAFRRRVAALTDEELQEVWELERLGRRRRQVMETLVTEQMKRGMIERATPGGSPYKY